MSPAIQFKRVLLCGSEGITVLALHKALIRAGYAIIGEVAEADEAVALARQLKPDLLLMDVELVNALEAIQEILQEQTFPIIVFSAYCDEAHAAEALATGATGYLIKPITVDQLLPAIETVVTYYQSVQAVVQANAPGLEKIETPSEQETP